MCLHDLFKNVHPPREGSRRLSQRCVARLVRVFLFGGWWVVLVGAACGWLSFGIGPSWDRRTTTPRLQLIQKVRLQLLHPSTLPFTCPNARPFLCPPIP